MAEVDFSNARIEPVGTQNMMSYNYLDLNTTILRDANNDYISNSFTPSRLINEQKQLIYLYQGTFTVGGTEFYMYFSDGRGQWKVSNISFNSGDTFVFQINATLTCN